MGDQMKKEILIIFTLLLSSNTWATLVNETQFETGKEWTWSYSEKAAGKDEWKEPYLYETYRVIERQGDEVTIAMASRSDISESFEPHHKFTINVAQCLKSGETLSQFLKLKISFYTKSLSEGWTLLSHHHKALAFTEKFNCFVGDLKKEEKWIDSLNRSIFQWIGLPEHSWYIQSDDSLNGVAYQRRAGDYRMQLVVE